MFQAEDGIRDLVRSRGLGDVYKRQGLQWDESYTDPDGDVLSVLGERAKADRAGYTAALSLIHI